MNIYNDEFKIRFLDGESMFNHYLIKYWFLGSWKDILNPDDLENIFDIIEEKLNAIAKEKGELCLTIPFAVIDCTRK